MHIANGFVGAMHLCPRSASSVQLQINFPNTWACVGNFRLILEAFMRLILMLALCMYFCHREGGNDGIAPIIPTIG